MITKQKITAQKHRLINFADVKNKCYLPQEVTKIGYKMVTEEITDS